MKAAIEDRVFFTESLISRWDSAEWPEVASFCQGAALISGSREIIDETGFLNSIAWKRNTMEKT